MSDWYEEMERAEQEYDAKLADEARAYQDGYQQGKSDKYQEIVSAYMLLTEEQVKEIRTDAIVEALEPYDAESIEDLAYNAYRKGGKEAIKRIRSRMKAHWDEYEEDRDNVPKPDFYSAYALIVIMEEHNNDSQI